MENSNRTEESTEQDDAENERKEIDEYNVMIQNGKAGTLQHEDVNDDLLQMASNEKDETFAEFRMKIDDYPDQILRYVLFVNKRTNL